MYVASVQLNLKYSAHWLAQPSPDITDYSLKTPSADMALDDGAVAIILQPPHAAHAPGAITHISIQYRLVTCPPPNRGWKDF